MAASPIHRGDPGFAHGVPDSFPEGFYAFDGPGSGATSTDTLDPPEASLEPSTDTGGGAGAAGTVPPNLVGGSGQPGPDGGEGDGLGDAGDSGRGFDQPRDVVDIAGRDIKPWKRGGPDPTRELLQQRLSRQATQGGDFEPVTFEAFVKKAVIVPGGEVEITLSVPKELKYAAIPLTDAAGFMVTIHAERTEK